MTYADALADENLGRIDQVIVNTYNKVLGDDPALVKINVNKPLYKITYQANSKQFNYEIVYDFMLDAVKNFTIYAAA